MKRFILALGLLLSTSVLAESKQATLVSDVLEASNIKVSLAAIPNQLSQLPAMLPDVQGKTPRRQQAFMQSFAATLSAKFDEAEAYKAVSAHFVEHGESDKLNEVHTWLKSPAGRAITQQETVKQTGDISAMQDFMTTFSPDALTTERRIVLQQFIDAMNMTDRIGNMTERMIPSLIRIFGEAQGKSPETIQNEVIRFANEVAPQMESFKAQMKPQMDMQMLASMAYMYSEVNDQDLEAYTAFIASEAGQHYLNLAMGSVLSYSLRWIEQVVPDIMAKAG